MVSQSNKCGWSKVQKHRSAGGAYLAAGIAVLVAVAASLNPHGDLSQLAIGAIGLGAIASLLRGARRMPKGRRYPWLLMAAAVALFMVGAVLRDVFDTVGDVSDSRSLWPDVASGPGYLLLAIGLIGVVRIRRRHIDGAWDSVLDGVLAGLAALALAWVFLVAPTIDSTSGGFWVLLSISAYPAITVIFVVLTAQLAFSRTSRPEPAFVVAMVAMVFLLVGDVLFTAVDGDLADLPTAATLLPYALAYAAIIFFTLHPSFTEFAEPMPPDSSLPSPFRLTIVGIALLVPAVVLVTRDDVPTADRAVLTGIIVVLTFVAVWRVVRALNYHARSERELLHQATHDRLTDTLNRDGLSLRVARAEESGVIHALLFIDMDRFKLVNDSYGHGFGDELLIAVARRLGRECGRRDLVARIGGDEFVIVTPHTGDIHAVVQKANRIRDSLAAPFMVRGTEIPVSVSVGIATDGSGGGAEALLRDADIAMYGAKDAGRDSVLVFDNSMRERVATRLSLERDLRHALEREEIAAHFQPVVDLRTGAAVGFEALMRWNHSERGLLGPIDFIPIAEETGLIVEMGAWILDTACEALVNWRNTIPGGDELWVSVNVSVRQLRDPDFVYMVDRVLLRHDLPPGALVLEITESHLLDADRRISAILNRISSTGVRLAIDDFGTGYSSLAYLHRFPFNSVKIDKEFVDNIVEGDGSSSRLVAAVAAMADALQLNSIAEGVETVDQAVRLVEVGCTTAQGFLYARPAPAAEIPATIERLGRGELDAVELGS